MKIKDALVAEIEKRITNIKEYCVREGHDRSLSDMLTEDFCSFEVAKLLKEKGFDEPCIFKYNSEGVRMKAGVAIDEWQNSELDDDECSCVSHQMAMRWLREVHLLHISVDVCPIYGKVKNEKGRNTCGLLYWNYMASGVWINDKYNPRQRAFVVSEKSHKNVVEAALKYSLGMIPKIQWHWI